MRLTFASATVLERRFGWAHAVPAYFAAGYVAASRLTADRHARTFVIRWTFSP